MTTKKSELNQMRCILIYTAWQDWKIFGYRTEVVKNLIKRIKQAKGEKNG